eukprot:6208818-Pleurochrysis_carterae.AAC.4
MNANRRGGAKPTMILRLARALAATTVARQASSGVIRELSATETASYSLMTARTVGISDSKPFQAAAIRGNKSVVNRKDTTVSCNSGPCSPPGGWRLGTEYRG